MKGAVRWLKRLLAVAAGCVVLLVLGLTAFLTTDFGHETTREILSRQLEGRYGLELSIESFDLDLLPPGLEVHGVVLTGGDEEPLVEVRQLSVELDGPALVVGRIEVEDISIDEPRVRLIIDDGGIANLPKLPPSSEEPAEEEEEEGGLGFSIEGAQLTSGWIQVELLDAPDGPLSITLTNIQLLVNAQDRSGQGGWLRVGGGSIEQGEENLEVRELAAAVRLVREQVRIEDFRFQLDDFRLDVHHATIGLSPPYDLTVGADLDLPLELVNRLPLPVPTLAGRLRLGAVVERREGNLRALGQLSLRRASLVVVGPAGEESPPTLAVGGLDLPFIFENDQLGVSLAMLDLPGQTGGRIQLQNVVLDLGEGSLPLEGEVNLERVVVRQILTGVGVSSPRISGFVNGLILVSGSLLPLSLDVLTAPFKAKHLSIQSGASEPIVALDRISLRGAVNVSTGATRVRHLSVIVGRQAKTGRLNFSGLIPHGTADAVNANVATHDDGFVLSRFGPVSGQAVDGTARLQAKLGGTWTNLSIDGELSLANPAAAGVELEELRGGFKLRNRVIELTSFMVKGRASQLALERARVELRKGGVFVDARASLEPLDLGDVARLEALPETLRGLRGQARGTVDVGYDGARGKVTADLSVRVRELALGEAAFGDAELEVGYDADEATLRRIRLKQPEGSLEVTGRVSEGRGLDVRAVLARYPIPTLDGLVPALAGLRAQVSGDVEVGGPLEKLSPRGRIRLAKTRFGGKIYGNTDLRFETVDRSLHVEGTMGGDLLRLETVEIGLASPYPLRVVGAAGPLVVEDVAPAGLLPDDLHARVGAQFRAEGELERLNSINGQISLDPVEVGFAGFDLRSERALGIRIAAGQMEVAGATVLVGATENEPGGAVHLDGLRLGLEGPFPLWTHGTIEVTSVTRLLGQEQLPDGLEARLRARFGVGGDLQDLASLRARLSINDLELRQGDLTVTNSGLFTLRLDGERAEVLSGRLALHSTSTGRTTGLALTGWASPEQLSLDLQGDLELGFLASLIAPVERSQGVVHLAAELTGTPEAPSLAGSATLRNGTFLVNGLGEPITGLRGVVRFSQNVILIEDFRGQVIGGDAEISGRVRLDGSALEDYRLDIALRNGTMPFGSRSAVWLNTNLQILSPTEDETLPLVTGNVEVARLEYAERIELEIDVGGLLTRGRTHVQTFDADAANVRLDISVTEGDGPLQLDNNVVEAVVHFDEAGGPLRVVGTDQAIGLLGAVRVEERGTVTYRNTEFQIDRGLLHFNRNEEIDASLNFLASTTVRQWDINLQVLGTMSDPQIQLTSSPALNDADIILLLAMGMTQAEFMQAGAAALTADILVGRLDDEIASNIPVFDEFRITTEYSERTNSAEPVVRVGRRLGRRFYLGARASFAQAQDITVEIEYEAAENLTFDVSYESDSSNDLGNVGIDATYRTEFGGSSSRSR